MSALERDEDSAAAQPPSNLPVSSRSFTTPELEAVIRRALELQSGGAGHADEGVSETDVVRIGQELGLSPAAVRRAMAEVRARPPEAHGALDGLVGPAAVRASRVVNRTATATAAILDRHLRDVELMLPQRRFAERTRYVQDASLAAGISRFARGFSRAHQPLNLKLLDVVVSPLDSGSCLVELSVDLGTTRGGIVAGVFGSSTVLATGWAATAWATAIPDPLMLLGVPVLGGAWLGMRAIYGSISRTAEEKLETLLDRLEHGEIG